MKIKLLILLSLTLAFALDTQAGSATGILIQSMGTGTRLLTGRHQLCRMARRTSQRSALPIKPRYRSQGRERSSPIVGTFMNLPDGGTITVGNNTFQADYEGGDGNDLTLTVVP